MSLHAASPDAVLPAVTTPQRTRGAGAVIIAAAVVSTIFVAMDHDGGGSTPLTILQGIARLQGLKELVHAVAIASVCGMAFGFATLARTLGLQRPLVLGGLTLYLFGSAAMIGATILDGFVTPHVAVDAIAATPERMAFAFNLVHYLNLILNDLAKLGWVLQAAGTLAWSADLLGRQRGRTTAIIGVLSSAAVLGLIGASPTSMTMAALLSVLVGQLVWNVAAGIFLMHNRDSAPHAESVGRRAFA